MINISVKKKPQIIIVILAIVIVCFMIRQIKHRRYNVEWYDLKEKIMNEHKTVDKIVKFSPGYPGPYCVIHIETKKEITFTEAEDIFLKILKDLNQTQLKIKLIEEHENKSPRSDLACLKIDIVVVEGKGQRYEFESWDRYEYRIWKFRSEGYDNIEYDLYDYK